MSAEQKKEAVEIFGKVERSNSIDYVGAWYYKAAQYIHKSQIRVAFVSTNSITQGEQVAPLWGKLFTLYEIAINFAYRTFKWSNEARGVAAVHCVIIGFSYGINSSEKKIYENELVRIAKNISPYLVDSPTIVIGNSAKPLCNVPSMTKGNYPTDDGNFILSLAEREALIHDEPESEQYIRRYMGANDYLNNHERYCLWLKDSEPSIIKKCPSIIKRIERVREFRLRSTALPTRQRAETPQLFFSLTQPESDYLLIPEVSSERRKYIPIGYMNKEVIASNTVLIIPNAKLFHFGVLTSSMHMAWMRCIAGRLKSDYRYTGSIVYNNFPWPNLSEKQKEDIGKAAKEVLSVRIMFPDSSLATLYDPDLTPPDLVKAHEKLDKLVEKTYGKSFADDSERVSFLFEEYRIMTEGLFVKENKNLRTVK